MSRSPWSSISHRPGAGPSAMGVLAKRSQGCSRRVRAAGLSSSCHSEASRLDRGIGLRPQACGQVAVVGSGICRGPKTPKTGYVLQLRPGLSAEDFPSIAEAAVLQEHAELKRRCSAWAKDHAGPTGGLFPGDSGVKSPGPATSGPPCRMCFRCAQITSKSASQSAFRRVLS